jgi:3-methyladenine DNA glycosylase AlkD
MHSYARQIKALLSAHANPNEAGPMKRYMRDQFEYLGLKGPVMGELMRQHYQAHGLPDLTDLDPILRDLWALPQREFQYAATGILSRSEDRLPAGFIRTLEYLLVTKSWWDTVDTISTGTLARHFKRYPKVKARCLAKWRKSKNFWLRRACILFQLSYKKDTDFTLMKDIIRENLGSNEFFINKAIGWALRQYTRVDPEGVRRFVAETPLQPLSAREALKWLAKRRGVKPPPRVRGT